MAEYWWIGYILMTIGWLLVGLLQKANRDKRRMIADLKEILELKKETKNYWYTKGVKDGMAFYKQAVLRQITHVVTRKRSDV